MATAMGDLVAAGNPRWTSYDTEGFYDEMFDKRGELGRRPSCWLVACVHWTMGS